MMSKKPVLLLLFLFLCYPVGWAGLAPAEEEAGVGVEGSNDWLVQRDIGGGLSFSLVRWCGSSALLVYGDDFGTEWVDLGGRKVKVSEKGTDYPVDCSPDGKWVIYRDRESARIYKDKRGRIPDNIVDDGVGWHGFVMDLYRYEVSTGTRQKFAMVRDDSSALVSPDGSKVFLGIKHDIATKMPEPAWEVLWTEGEGFYLDELWFPDSSGVAAQLWGEVTTLVVEFFGVTGWSKEFDLEQLDVGVRLGVNASLHAVDGEGGLYYSTSEKYGDGSRRYLYYFYRCRIEERELLCDKTGKLGVKMMSHSDVRFLPSGDVIFKEEGDDCIRLLKSGGGSAECIAGKQYGEELYDEVNLVGVSSDGRLLAVRRGKSAPRRGDRFYAYRYDLFVVELSTE